MTKVKNSRKMDGRLEVLVETGSPVRILERQRAEDGREVCRKEEVQASS